MSLSAASFSSSVRGDPPVGDSTALNRSRSGELVVGGSVGLWLHEACVVHEVIPFMISVHVMLLRHMFC